jgi:hypothetical protein
MRMPNGWNEVTIKKLIESSDISSDTEMNDIEKMAYMVSVMGDIPILEVEQLPLKKTKELFAELNWMNTPPSDKFINEFTIDGITYKINPAIQSLTFAQFQAFDHFTKDKEMVSKNIHNLMAIVCMPDVIKYDMISASDRATIFYDKMTVDIVHPVSAFFFGLLNQSLKNIQHSLELKIDKAQKMVNKQIAEIQDK